MSKEFPILYKKSSKGKLQQWKIWTEGNTYLTSHGYVDGKIVEDVGTVCEGKNLGRSNETSPEVQAILEAESKWKKQLDKGYKLSIEETDELVLLPMLAQSFEKRAKDIEWPAIAQRKFDGIRCLAYKKDGKVELITRKGKPFPHLNHIRAELVNIIQDENTVFDGELFTDKVPFEQITGTVRREKLKEGDEEKMKLIDYHVYDCILMDDLEAGFMTRYIELSEMISQEETEHIILVENDVIIEPQVKSKHDEYVQDGFEGIMLRNINGLYAINKRSKDLQKYKYFCDNEYKIVGFEQAKGNEIGTVIWVCTTEKNQTFNVRPRGSREQRQEWFENGDEYVGQMLTVRYQELSQDGIPRFPVGVAVRDYE